MTGLHRKDFKQCRVWLFECPRFCIVAKNIECLFSNVALFFFVTILALPIEHIQASEVLDISTTFVPSGWMGDGEYGRKYIDFSGTNTENPHSSPTSIKVTYTFGPTRWGGIYWQNVPDNWGSAPGKNLAGRGITKITFWARGKNGNEVVEFKAGGINSPGRKFSDSFDVTIGRVILSNIWKKYEISLKGLDLTSVIGGFCWIASADYNAGSSITFYLDDIDFE